MNIISNSCIYAILCRDHWKCQYGNPFCWNYIDTENMYNLIKNFDNINWFNYELVKDKDWNFSIIIDNKVKVNYVHYKFNKNEKELTKHGSNLSNNHIWEYIVEEYEKRVKRMLEKKEKPIFILGTMHENTYHKYDTKFLEFIDNLDTQYEVILFSNLYVFKNKKTYHYNENQFQSNFGLAKYIREKLKI